ncbi:MAG: cupin domain-containing protein [Desulfobulbaceae bacterium]|nr:cupin domain-containing protein [Desulfobulbaceae bacterium]
MSIVCIDSAEHFEWGDNCDGWHFVKSKNLSIVQERVPSGCSETMHYHRSAEQFFFVLNGTATIEIEGKKINIEANNGIHIPPGKKHQLGNQNEADLVFLVTTTPILSGDRVEV